MKILRQNDRYLIINGSIKNTLVIFVGMDSPLFGHENQYLKIAETANVKYGLLFLFLAIRHLIGTLKIMVFHL